MRNIGSMPLPRWFSRSVLALGISSCAMLASCGPPSTLPTKQPETLDPAKQVAVPTPASPPVQVVRLTLGALQRHEVRQMSACPNRFDPTGRFVADDEEHTSLKKVGLRMRGEQARCQVWDARTGVFITLFPHKACAAFAPGRELSLSSESCLLRQFLPEVPNSSGMLTSPDGSQWVEWQGAKLSVRRLPAAEPHARYAPTCAGAHCPPIAAVAWAVDGQHLAVAHAGESRILVLDARDGRVVATLPLAPDDVILGDMLAFGPGGVFALAGMRLARPDLSEHEIELSAGPRKAQKRAAVNLYQFRTLTEPPRFVETDLGDRIVLDPYGRFLFSESHGDGGAASLTSWNLISGGRGPFSFEGIVDDMGAYGGRQVLDRSYEIRESQWIPGLYPILETLEIGTASGEPSSFRATRLRTGPRPGDVHTELVELTTPPPDPCRKRVVRPDGRTVVLAKPGEKYDSCGSDALDPSRRFTGAGKGRLRRVADDVTLTISESGCAETQDNLYSCLTNGRAMSLFFGDDPARLITWQGDQLLPLLYRPNLIADFFAGRPLLLPKNTYVGQPPVVTLLEARPRSTPPGLALLLRISQSAGAVTLRAFATNRELGAPIALAGSEEQTVTLSLPAKLCEDIALYVCSERENVCSFPAAARFCEQKRSKP